MTTNVALLPEKWRQFAEVLRGMKGGRNYRVRGAGIVAAAHIEDCADELAAALAHRQDGELLALADRIDFAATHAQNNGGNMSWKYARDFAHELRTLAASPREVEATDEMVERAIRAGCATCPGEYPPNWPDGFNSDEQAHGRAFMRSALTAAMQPDTLSKSQVKRIALERGESPGLADSGEVG